MIDFGNTAFVLICAAMVCFMIPGLAFFYCGLVRRKNALTIMMQSFVAMGVVAVVWFVCGFSLAFGKDVGGVIGGLEYAFLNGVGLEPNGTYAASIPFLAFFLFQLMFAVITPALITGAFADRVSFKSYLIFLAAWCPLVYAPCAHWVWGGGFLQQMGVVDFAGGIVIHCSAGMAALAAIRFVGKRRIRPDEDTSPYSVPYIALGTGILWFGWFGFNGGSALAANGIAAVAFSNTAIAGATAMLTWMLMSWRKTGHPSIVEAMTGIVAGLAAVTPASGYVAPWAAALIGVAAGVICRLAIRIPGRRGLDDALDVWGVHGVGGMLGAILVGVFAQAGFGGLDGLIAGNMHLLLVQILAVVIVAAYSFVVTFVMLKAIQHFIPVKVSEVEELAGLDGIFHEAA
ncbi:MAG: ammonium transporter [Clostridiaceae bacterium]|nr:ammonium transporter [Clostridiaceae bacterium]